MPDDISDASAPLISLIRAQRQLHGTGVVKVGDGKIFIVFGHPLHATLGDDVGLDAVAAIGGLAAAQPAIAAEWEPGVSGGSLRSLRPTDDIERRLASRIELRPDDEQAPFGSPSSDPPSMRTRFARGDEAILKKAATADAWGLVAAAVCALLETRLHRHSRDLTDLMRSADRSAGGLRAAILEARALALRAISPSVQSELLDAAEQMVAQHEAQPTPA